MENQDQLTDFLGNLADKIKTAKEHKSIMEAVYASASASEVIKEQEDPFINFLQKVGNTVVSKLPKKETESLASEAKPSTQPTDEAATLLGIKIRQALENVQEQPFQKAFTKDEVKTDLPVSQQLPVEVEDENRSAKNLAQKIRDAIDKAKNRALEQPALQQPEVKQEEQENNQITGYIEELEKIKDTGTEEQKEEATTSLKEIKKYIDKTVQDYARRILDLGGGGGSVAVQYAKGGTMDGTLNVNGHILSGGKNIANYFGTGGSDPAVNSVVYSNSANWNSTYTTVNTYSGAWSTGLQTLGFNESDAQLSISNGNVVSLSALSGNDINSILNYFSTNNITVSGLTVTQNLSVGGTIYSSATALVIAEYETLIGNGVNTSFTVNHNLNTDNIQVVVYDVSNNIASYPSIQILNSNSVSIGFSFVPPLNYYRVLVFGTVPSNQINAYGTTSTIYVVATGAAELGQIPLLSGNWNSNYTTTNLNSAFWNTAYTNLVANSANYLSGVDISLLASASGNWNSTYTTVQNNSASWVGGGGGNSAYSTTIGNGTDASFVITHNLGTTSVVVQVHDVNTTEVVYPMIQTTSANTTTLLFDVVPTVNQFQVVVLAAGGGGGGGEIAATIPVPILKWDQTSSTVPPTLYATYAPCLTSSWLSSQTEVWLFAYRRNKRTRYKNVERFVSGYVHPADTTRWAANAGKPLYAGDPSRIYHTEFSFTSSGQIPVPYQQVSLSAFNPLEFYKNRRDGNPQVSASDFPFVYDDITGNGYGLGLPRMNRDTTTGKNLKLYLAFRFAIPNPDTTSKYPKLFGPPAFLTVSPHAVNGINANNAIDRMTYATKQSK